jgi:hypothetical protein
MDILRFNKQIGIMKKMIFTAIAALFVVALSSQSSVAQKSLSEGMVKFKITDIKGDFDEAALEQMRTMMGSTETTIYFKSGNLRTSVNMMGGMMMTNTFVEDEKVTMYVDAMGQKVKVELDSEDELMKQQEEVTEEDFDILVDKNDKKDIAGYSCHRITLVPKSQDDNEHSTVVLYVTDKIEANNNVIQNLNINQSIDGFPLEYTISAEGLYLTSQATEVSGELPKDAFDYDEKGYKIMSMDEYMQMFGGMR